MLLNNLYPNSCNRREFVLATGLIIVGGISSCDKKTEVLKPIKKVVNKQKQTLPDIRVRIGKNTNSVKIGNKSFFASSIGDEPKTIELKQSTKVVTDGKEKTISGTIILHPRTSESKKTLDVVAHISIEKYLPGVIAGELLSHWHPTTFAAQAIAARSYAVAQHLDRNTKSHFDVTDEPTSQVFLGDVTHDVAHRAVQETAGVVLRWNNKIIPAYYCACCGGIPALATDAISGAEQHKIPPLSGHDNKDVCTSFDIHKWSTTRLSRTFRKRLNGCAKKLNIPDLKDLRSIRVIEPLETNKHGRTTTLGIVDRRKKIIEMRARDFIRAANSSVVRLPDPEKRLWSPFVVGQKMGSKLKFDGYGMGHGVGLCQYGTQKLAGQGKSWHEILEWYYPQAEINS
ncbi:MAG: SpoIID/LytB domain-containing protein [Phycisphaerales bacterium]|nr:SpoIID/LytB domain-containing protein [Phycisphaerales bacterium]